VRAFDWLGVAFLAYCLDMPNLVAVCLVIAWVKFGFSIMLALDAWRREREAERYLRQARAFKPRGDK
jgi:hypothetical protein